MKIVLMALLLAGCSTEFPGKRELGKSSDAVTKKLKEEFNLEAFGTGACWKDKCSMLEFSFMDRSSVEIEKARNLIIQASKEAIQLVDSNKEFYPYLAKTPFNEKHLMMRITFKNNAENSKGIDQVSITRGIIRYKTWDELAFSYHTLHEETYDEALSFYN